MGVITRVNGRRGVERSANAEDRPALRCAQLAVLLLCGAAVGAGCASSRAQTIEDRPTLTVPPGVDWTSTSPSWSWTMRNTIDRPMPLPFSLVVK